MISHRYFTRSTGNMMQQILFSASAHELWLLGGVKKQSWPKVEQLGFTLGQPPLTQFNQSAWRLMRTDDTVVPQRNITIQILLPDSNGKEKQRAMGGCVSKLRKWLSAVTGAIWKEERSGQGLTEQSKNRRRQDKVIKDRTVEGEARRGEEGRRGHKSRGMRQDWTGRGGREQDWVIIMVIESGSEHGAAEWRWLTQMHFGWNMECHSTPKGGHYQSKVRKYT